METKFNSQTCTTREQSERLIALGLKKETADMVYMKIGNEYIPYLIQGNERNIMWRKDIPAWSLHRLIEIMPNSIYHKNLFCFLFVDTSVYVGYRNSLYGASQTIMEQFMKSNLWENLINCIEWLIKEGYFPKENLENGDD